MIIRGRHVRNRTIGLLVPSLREAPIWKGQQLRSWKMENVDIHLVSKHLINEFELTLCNLQNFLNQARCEFLL